jgi:GT2 family glycosyltransferase
MTYGLAITTWNRFDLTIHSFARVIDDPRISRILILDDASTDGSYDNLRGYFDGIDKVTVTREVVNRGMSIAKRNAIALCTQPHCIILDSDNEIGPDYLDALDKLQLQDDTIYCPDWAMPQFDYRAFSGQTIDASKVKQFLHKPMFEQLLNTCNYLVPSLNYCKVYRHDESVKETDTLHFAYLWLKAGYKFYVVPGMRYNHLVHAESGWLKNADYNIRRGNKTLKLIEQL